MDKKTTSEIIKMFDCHRHTAEKWAKKNGIEAIRGPNGNTITYLWSEDDIARFKERPKPGGYRRKEKI
jgi:transposase